MDAMGDADELADDEFPPSRPPLVTGDTLALSGLVLVVTSPLLSNLFQFLGFVVLTRYRDGGTPAWQYTSYAVPSAVMAALGAASGLRATRDPRLSGWARPVAGAAVLVGALLAVVVVLGVVAAFALGDTNF